MKKEGAAPGAVEGLRRQYPALPPAYLEFLLGSNGAEGLLDFSPGQYSLWPVESVLRFNVEHEVFQNLPGHFAIGSSLGGELFVLKLRGSTEERAAVYRVPFVPMEEAEVVKFMASFAALVEAMRR